MTMQTRRMTSVSNTISIAKQLHYEGTSLLELFEKKDSFSSILTVPDVRLVPVQQSSDSEGRLQGLHSALVRCQGLMDKTVSEEEEELGNGEMGEYERQRRTVSARLEYLIATIGKMLKAPIISVGTKVECPSPLFDLKLWIYRVFKEITFWAKMAISTLQALHTEPVLVGNQIELGTSKKPSRPRTSRSSGSSRSSRAL